MYGNNGNKKLQYNQLQAGPGVIVYESRLNQTMWVNNENVDIETVTTNVSVDQVYIDQQVQRLVSTMMETHLREHLRKLISNHVSLDYIVWDDKGTLTTRVLVDGKCALEKSVEIPLMDISNKPTEEDINVNV